MSPSEKLLAHVRQSAPHDAADALEAAPEAEAAVVLQELNPMVLIVLLVLMTRGLHQDGLADTLDGLAGGRTAADRLRIMRDPSVGALGATGLFLSLLLRYAGLLALPQPLRLPVLVCMPALGRWAMVSVAWASPYARSEGGLAAAFLTHLSRHHVLLSSLVLASALTIGVGAVAACATIGMGILLVLLCGRDAESGSGA